MNSSWKAALALLVLLTTSCGSFEPGKPMSMDEDDASREVEKIAFAIPDGFQFTQGVMYSEFVGQPAWSARFDAPKELDGPAVTAANPSYPPLQPATCGTATKTSWTSLGFSCEAEMLSMSRPAQGSRDPVSVVFTRGARGSSLYIYCAGH
ncbi:hypothetical protein CH286_27420 [Rhodococcus sp. WWJCD1]|uniref:hypothetical protein n=1 Tax=Rhodococcus sp. WWJCD1 TaxID=2022519 RepID=UPI000B9BE81C|nr:hypothetical protein [Rhodococcus sp. WWJCD1]OZC41421.1 hypothetical protein CH286_27315 [Rhodococcus sp. WWJCD1]OZC41440.1 hypothetical protein CH286_27420 [Rhodococcus sp. WWJCD1]